MSEQEAVVRSVEFCLETFIPKEMKVKLLPIEGQGEEICDPGPDGPDKNRLHFWFRAYEPGPRQERVLTIKISPLRFLRSGDGRYELDTDAICRLQNGAIHFFGPWNTLDRDDLVID